MLDLAPAESPDPILLDVMMSEMHGSEVGLVSEPGVDSTFTVWLPWRAEAVVKGN